MQDYFPLFFADVQNEARAFTGSKYNQIDSPINFNKYQKNKANMVYVSPRHDIQQTHTGCYCSTHCVLNNLISRTKPH